MLLLIYPVFETLFSIYRRRAGNTNTVVNPDALHLHQLIYRRLVRQHRFEQDPDLKTRRNAAVAPYLWLASVLAIAPATLFWRYDFVLIGFCILFCLTYVWLYRRIVRFSAPKWLIRF